MEAALIYILKWAVCLAVLYIPFTLLLRRENLATFNRRLLLGIVILSATLPSIEIHVPIKKEIITEYSIYLQEEPAPAERVTRDNSVPTTAKENGELEQHVLRKILQKPETYLFVYLLGVMISTIHATYSISIIGRRLKRGTLWREKRGAMTIYCHADNREPFSWFGNVAISENDYNECGNEILLHEEGHIRHHHSWDMLFLRAVKAVQWFNPFVYMLSNDIKEIHEYEADRYVLSHYNDAKSYQLLIVKKATATGRLNIANNFNQSNVRHRIEMMIRNKSSYSKAVKAVYLVPVTLLCIAAFAKPEYIYSTPTTTIVQLDNNINEQAETTIHTPETTNDIVVANDKTTTEAPPVDDMHDISKSEVIGSVTADATEKAATAGTIALPAASLTLCEYLDIDRYGSNTDFDNTDIVKCSTKALFVCDKSGKAHDIRILGNNIALEGSTHSPTLLIDAGKHYAGVAEKYISTRLWQPASNGVETVETYIEIHLIFCKNEGERHLGSNRLMVGSTPIE